MHGRIVTISTIDSEPMAPADYEIISEYGGAGHFDYVTDIPDEKQTEELEDFIEFLEDRGQKVDRESQSFRFDRGAFFDVLFSHIQEDDGKNAIIEKCLTILESYEYIYPVIDNGWGLDISFVHHALNNMVDGETYRIGTFFEVH